MRVDSMLARSIESCVYDNSVKFDQRVGVVSVLIAQQAPQQQA